MTFRGWEARGKLKINGKVGEEKKTAIRSVHVIKTK